MNNCKKIIAFIMAMTVLNMPVLKTASYNNHTLMEASAADNSLKITSQPNNVSSVDGVNIVFSIVASGSNLKYQWQYKYPNGEWKNWTVDSAKNRILRFDAPTSYNGLKVRCIVTDGIGNTVTSEEASLTIGASLNITTQPTSVMYKANDNVSFNIVAAGSNLTYQW